MNIYCRLSQLKRDDAGVTNLANASDTVLSLLQTADDVSREFDRECGRMFYAYQDTRYFSGEGLRKLLLGDDLISITTIKVADTADQPVTFENTLTVLTDYTFWPRNAAGKGEPYRGVEANPNGQYSAFPVGVENVQIIGLFGYSNETESAGTTAEALDASETGVDLTAGHSVEPGDTIWVDSEQMYVSSVASNMATVTRGVNGTTAATHLTAAAVTVRRYPRDVERVIKERAVGARWDTQSGYAGAANMEGNTDRAVYGRWRNAIRRYGNPAGVT